jgi:hypothetical protein
MKILFLIIISLFTRFNVYCQQANHGISKDSIAVWESRKLTHPLSLKKEQVVYVSGAIKSHIYELENIKKLKLNDSSRIAAVKESEKRFNRQMKAILSQEQYDKYTSMIQKNKGEFVQRQNQKKVKVKSMAVDE